MEDNNNMLRSMLSPELSGSVNPDVLTTATDSNANSATSSTTTSTSSSISSLSTNPSSMEEATMLARMDVAND